MTRTHDDMHENVVSPLRDQRGVPFCSTDGCPQYDGKRCRALGFQVRGGSVCEVAVIDLLSDLTRLTSALAETERARETMEHKWAAAVAAGCVIESERDAYRAMVADLLASAHPHPVEHPAMARQWERARDLLKNGPRDKEAGLDV